MKWQPIETAPKDGTRFIAAQRYDDNYSIWISEWVDRETRNHGKVTSEYRGWAGPPLFSGISKPTLWAPIPAFPDSANADS